MVQKVNNEMEVNKPAYIYYLMSKSGQCSPTSDTLDSGTGSDLETTSNSNGSAYNLCTKYSAIGEQIRQFSGLSVEPPRRIKTNRTSTNSYNTDSEESESSLSCDSLNSDELLRLKNGSTTTTIIRSTPFSSSGLASPMSPIDLCPTSAATTVYRSDENNVTKISCLPTSLLRDIRGRTTSKTEDDEEEEEDEDDGGAYHDDSHAVISMADNQCNASDISSASYTNAPFNLHQPHRNHSNRFDRLFSPDNHSMSDSIQSSCTSPSSQASIDRTNVYENDKYIAFHMNEYASTANEHHSDAEQSKRNQDDDSFAGYRDVQAQAATTVSNIFSSKGTIRGVKNRVRNGIATFLQMQQTNVKVS